MLPLRDLNPAARRPIVTMLFMVACITTFVFVQPQSSSSDSIEFTYERAGIPCEITQGRPLSVPEIRASLAGGGELCTDRPVGREAFPNKQIYLALIVSLFLHGSWMHLLGNMWFLWLFGNNVEDAMGPGRYLLFYLAGGLVAAAAHIAISPNSAIPVVGASGAIAAVMGTYAVLFPNAPIQSLFLILPVQIRARSWLALWFVSQFFIDRNARVAWAAHVGGFVFGVVVGLIMRARRPRSASRPSGTPGVLRDPYAHEWVPRHY